MRVPSRGQSNVRVQLGRWPLVNLELSRSSRDEDMQSIASLMSIGKSEIGNMDDLEDEDFSMDASLHKDSSAARINEIAAKFAQFDMGDDDEDLSDLRGQRSQVHFVMFVYVCSSFFSFRQSEMRPGAEIESGHPPRR